MSWRRGTFSRSHRATVWAGGGAIVCLMGISSRKHKERAKGLIPISLPSLDYKLLEGKGNVNFIITPLLPSWYLSHSTKASSVTLSRVLHVFYVSDSFSVLWTQNNASVHTIKYIGLKR